MPDAWDEEVDFIIVGSGAGAMTAALLVRQAGARPLVLEKAEVVGGSTAISGGVLWVPNNLAQQRAGVPDTHKAASTYLEACAARGGLSRGVSAKRRQAFLDYAPQAVAFLERLGMKFLHAEGYSDYHEGELPGGHARGRSLVSPVFNARKLGAWQQRLRRNRSGKTGVPVLAHELPKISLNGGTLESKIMMAKIADDALLRSCHPNGGVARHSRHSGAVWERPLSRQGDARLMRDTCGGIGQDREACG